MNGSTASIRIAGPQALALDALTRDAALGCAACPLLVQCAAYGRTYRLERGVYGAMTFHQRNGPTRAAYTPEGRPRGGSHPLRAARREKGAGVMPLPGFPRPVFRASSEKSVIHRPALADTPLAGRDSQSGGRIVPTPGQWARRGWGDSE